jgi:hypothetical protein
LHFTGQDFVVVFDDHAADLVAKGVVRALFELLTLRSLGLPWLQMCYH